MTDNNDHADQVADDLDAAAANHRRHIDDMITALADDDQQAARQAAGRWFRARAVTIIEATHPAMLQYQQLPDDATVPIDQARALSEIVAALATQLVQASALLLAEEITAAEVPTPDTDQDQP